MKLTREAILAALEVPMTVTYANGVVAKKDIKDFVSYEVYSNRLSKFETFTFEHVERHGGCEGAGEEYWIVFKTINEGTEQYWFVDGFYMSHEGGNLEWDDLYEVEPYEKTVTDYRKV